MHQGDQDGIKGLYHVNAVDEQQTQFPVVLTVERISEQFMLPALESMLDTLPFVIRVFMLTMERNTSTSAPRRRSTSYVWKSPSRAVDKLTIMHWWEVRTVQ